MTLTRAGRLFYGRAIEILKQIDHAESELRQLSGQIAAPLKVGLMPTFTRGLLAPVLNDFLGAYPAVDLTVVEAYSAVLTGMVLEGASNFAIVPAARGGRPDCELSRDRSRDPRQPPARALGASGSGAPEGSSQPLNLVLPAPGNARRDAIEAFIAESGLRVATIVDMDAMIATLEFVRSSDHVTILPATRRETRRAPTCSGAQALPT